MSSRGWFDVCSRAVVMGALSVSLDLAIDRLGKRLKDR